MKKDSLIYKYKKALKENENRSSKAKQKIHYNFITKLFLRIFLSTLILLGLVVTNKITISKKNIRFTEYTIEKSWNFLKLVTVFNGLFGEFIVLNNDVLVSETNFFDRIDYVDSVNHIVSYSFDGAHALASGVVIKIERTKNNTYNLTIQGQDDYVYTYMNLKSIDFSIYSYIQKGTVIGLVNSRSDGYCYDLVIKKDGVFYDYYEINQD